MNALLIGGIAAGVIATGIILGTHCGSSPAPTPTPPPAPTSEPPATTQPTAVPAPPIGPTGPVVIPHQTPVMEEFSPRPQSASDTSCGPYRLTFFLRIHSRLSSISWNDFLAFQPICRMGKTVGLVLLKNYLSFASRTYPP